MPHNRAFRIHGYGGPEVLTLDDAPVPIAGPGQVVVAVKAAGVNAFDWKLREGYVRDAFPLSLPAVLGIEFAGEVTEAQDGSSRFAVGDRVMGLLHTLGAYAEHVAVDEDKLARVPEEMANVDAAALPVAVLTAWQALHAAGDLRPGMTVLVHAAAGGVGGFAVQFAKAAGANVIATASAKNHDHVTGLGADTVIDYRTERFEARAKDVDLVLDLVGGETLDRSWGVLAPGGAVVSTVAYDIAGCTPPGARGFWLMTQHDPAQLEKVAQDIVAGRVRSTVAEVFGMNGLPAAIERTRGGHAPGKIVVDFTR